MLLKATAGGGGKGMQVVQDAKAFPKAWEVAKREAQAAFANDGLYLEKLIQAPRHIEIQIASDQTGYTCHLFERDCSIQRRHQKLVEEAPSPFVTPSLREQMGQAAIKAATAIGYEGVGTVEFLVDEARHFYFMEMNTRIQVEHPVTEEVVDLDLVKEQIKIATGKQLSKQPRSLQGHAIECRINAEDPSQGFRPCPGKITHLHLPGGPDVRVDTYIYAGYTVPPQYDAMVAKLIVRGPSRQEAIVKMARALEEFVIEGIHTTIPLHRCLMRDAKFRAGEFTTAFLDDFDLTGLGA